MHLDVKPDNILVTKDGVCKLGDFGLAVTADSLEDGREGDCRYLAPELVDRSADFTLQPSADMFSVGMLAFELVTQLEVPSAGSEWHRLRDGHSRKFQSLSLRYSLSLFTECQSLFFSFVPARQYMMGVGSEELVNLIVSLLSPNPRDRPSAAEVTSLAARMPHQYSHPDVKSLLETKSS